LDSLSSLLAVVFFKAFLLLFLDEALKHLDLCGFNESLSHRIPTAFV
jgi:hypothetical protein